MQPEDSSWISGVGRESDASIGTDRQVVTRRYVSQS